MSKKKQEKEVRYIYKKDPALSSSGYVDFDDAKKVEEDTRAKHPEPEYRVRLRLRSRTNTWDVVVKVRTEVKEQAPLTAKEIQDRKDEAFIAHHALTGS